MRFLKFLLFGGGSAAITLLCRHILQFIVIFEVAVALSQLIGSIVAFLLQRVFVFQTFGPPLPAYFRFLAVNIGSLLMATATSALCYRLLLPALGYEFHLALTAHFVGLLSTAPLSYLAHREITFRPPPNVKQRERHSITDL